jgi:hypothetical protein
MLWLAAMMMAARSCGRARIGVSLEPTQPDQPMQEAVRVRRKNTGNNLLRYFYLVAMHEAVLTRKKTRNNLLLYN